MYCGVPASNDAHRAVMEVAGDAANQVGP